MPNSRRNKPNQNLKKNSPVLNLHHRRMEKNKDPKIKSRIFTKTISTLHIELFSMCRLVTKNLDALNSDFLAILTGIHVKTSAKYVKATQRSAPEVSCTRYIIRTPNFIRFDRVCWWEAVTCTTARQKLAVSAFTSLSSTMSSSISSMMSPTCLLWLMIINLIIINHNSTSH